MNEFIKVVLSLSLSGTLLLLILRLLKPLYQHKLSKRWQYYIWLLVVARLLIPFTPETTFVGSLFQYLDKQTPEIVGTIPDSNEAQPELPADNGNITPSGESPESQPASDVTPTHFVVTFLFYVYENLGVLWAAIAFALLLRKVTMYQSFVRFVKAGRVEVSDLAILNLLSDVGETVGVKRPVELFVNPLVSSPMLLGFFRPSIILPQIDLESPELAFILRHELTHFKRLDMFYKWLVQLTACLHWYNPFVYLMVKEINRNCELACDESIIQTLNHDEQRAYGDTLLHSLKTVGQYKSQCAAVTLTESAEQIKERLDAIMRFQKASKLTITTMIAITLVLAMGATTIGAYAPRQSSPPKNEVVSMPSQLPASSGTVSGTQQTSKGKSTRQESLVSGFAPFRSFGLIYDTKLDRVFWNNREVKAFVDIRGMFSGGEYSFNLGYTEPDSNSTLYLMAVRDRKGSLTGIQEMSAELKNDLYGNISPEESGDSDLEDEIKENISEIDKSKAEYSPDNRMYLVFDATTNINGSSITATDHFNSTDIPKKIADWILTCEGSEQVCVNRTTTNGTTDAWLYYDSDTRLAWTMSADETTAKFTLLDNAPKIVSGATLIHFQTPEAYRKLEVFYQGEKLKINIYDKQEDTKSVVSDGTSSVTPWAAMGATKQPYTYSQASYYQGNYIFELGWNLSEDALQAYPDKTNLTFADRTSMTVSFDQACKWAIKDSSILSNLKDLIEKLKTENSLSTPLKSPLVTGVKDVSGHGLAELAEEYYADKALTKFAAIFPSLDSALQKSYCTKMMEDGRTAFLASNAANMKADLLDYCVENIYRNDQIALFGSIAPYLSDSQKEILTERASRDNKVTFLGVLKRS